MSRGPRMTNMCEMHMALLALMLPFKKANKKGRGPQSQLAAKRCAAQKSAKDKREKALGRVQIGTFVVVGDMTGEVVGARTAYRRPKMQIRLESGDLVERSVDDVASGTNVYKCLVAKFKAATSFTNVATAAEASAAAIAAHMQRFGGELRAKLVRLHTGKVLKASQPTVARPVFGLGGRMYFNAAAYISAAAKIGNVDV